MKTFFFIATALVLAASAQAQQRSAGQAYDAQVNWGVLGSKLDAVSTQNKALAAALTTLQGSVDGINLKLDAIAACGAQGKVWNGKVCVASTTTPQTAEARWVAHGATGCMQESTMNIPNYLTRQGVPACSGMLGATCTTKGQVCRSGLQDVCNMTTETIGSPNSSGRDVTRRQIALGLSICQ